MSRNGDDGGCGGEVGDVEIMVRISWKFWWVWLQRKM